MLIKKQLRMSLDKLLKLCTCLVWKLTDLGKFRSSMFSELGRYQLSLRLLDEYATSEGFDFILI